MPPEGGMSVRSCSTLNDRLSCAVIRMRRQDLVTFFLPLLLLCRVV